jgi:hypothetical protein
LKNEGNYATASFSKNLAAISDSTHALAQQMKMSVTDASDSFAGILEISKKGQFDFESLMGSAEGMLNQAANLGIEGKKGTMQVLAAAQLASKDMGTDQSAAAVSSFLADLAKAKMEKTFEAVGIDFERLSQEAWHSGDYIGHVVNAVMERTKGNEIALSKIFKNDGSKDLIRAIAANSQEYKAMWQSAEKADHGAALNDKTTALQSISAQWKLFNVQLTKTLDLHVAPWLEKVTAVMNWFTTHPQIAAAAVKTFLGLFTVSWGFKALSGLNDLRKGIVSVAGVAKGLGSVGFGGIQRLGPMLKTATAASWKFVASLLAQAAAWAMTPMGMITIAIAALAAGAVLIYKNWDKVRGFFIKLWGWIKTAFTAAWDWVTDLFSKASGWVTWFFPIIKIPQLIIQNWDKIKAFFSGLWSWLTGAFSGAWAWFTGFLARIPAGFLSVIGAVKSAISKIWDAISGFFAKFKDAGKNIVQSIWDGMKTIITKPVDAIKGMVGKIRNFLPFSPAKEGPLRDLHKIKIVETIADTIEPAPLKSKFGSVLKAAMPLAASAALAAPLAAKAPPTLSSPAIAVPVPPPIAFPPVQSPPPAKLPAPPQALSALSAPIQVTINIDAHGAAPDAAINIEKAVMKLIPQIERALAQAAERNTRARNRP